MGWEEASESALSHSPPREGTFPAEAWPPMQASVPPRNLHREKQLCPQGDAGIRTGLKHLGEPLPDAQLSQFPPLPHKAARVSSISQSLSDSVYYEVWTDLVQILVLPQTALGT